MIQLFIPLIGLSSLLAYYFLSNDMKASKRIHDLEKMKNLDSADTKTGYYGWELHELI